MAKAKTLSAGNTDLGLLCELLRQAQEIAQDIPGARHETHIELLEALSVSQLSAKRLIAEQQIARRR